MIYKFPITTPANTTEAAPIKTIMKLCKGVVHKLDIVFPPGPQKLLHLIIRDSLHQVWPSTTGTDFASDGESIIFREHYDLKEDPLELYAFTWNEDDTNAHSIIIRLGILRKMIVSPWLVSWSEKLSFNQ